SRAARSRCRSPTARCACRIAEAAGIGQERIVERRYRVAIAGCHRMLERTPAGHNWAAAFAADPRAELVAVFDKGAETRRAFLDCWGPLPAFDDYAALLAAMRPDVVCIATRQTLHAEQLE